MARLTVNLLLFVGIWKFVQRHAHAAKWVQKRVCNLKELKDEEGAKYDVVIVSCGMNAQGLWEQEDSDAKQKLSLHYVNGQTIILRDPLHDSSGPPPTKGLSHAIISGEYVIPHPSKPGYLLCGATKENTYTRATPTVAPAETCASTPLTPALEHLLGKVALLYPPLASAYRPEEQWSGTRVISNRPQNSPRLPLVLPHPDISNCWLLTALGSRGLIHHAVVAECAHLAVMQQLQGTDVTCVPPEMGKSGYTTNK
jgi:glycine/D-amino acid oxidase-like deaminating enzyme